MDVDIGKETDDRMVTVPYVASALMFALLIS